jgi:PTH1 family peptidyl-tRNA hydrolase
LPQSGIKLIVGLGNPGLEYESTRHNAGAWFINILSDMTHETLSHEPKFHGLFTRTRLHETEVYLLIPQTYMNRSGLSVKTVANYYKIPPEAILVAHDDVDIPVGDIRLKFDGGAGGHNGLVDIIGHLGTRQFYRLRIGVGRPKTGKEVIDYVLKPPKKTERLQIDSGLQEACKVIPCVLEGNFQKAMRELHGPLKMDTPDKNTRG